MSRKSFVIAALCSVVLGAAIVYVLGKWFPYDTFGEGPWPENYRGD